MIKTIASPICIVLLSLFIHSFARGQAVIKVEGEVTHPLQLSLADLSKMKRVEVKAADHDGKERTYSGIPLSDLLREAGAAIGPELRGKNMAKYLLVKSTDGYEVIFSLPELDSAFTNRLIILADQVDGSPLPANKGPFRVVVPGEKKPARWIWQVTTLSVRSAKE